MQPPKDTASMPGRYPAMAMAGLWPAWIALACSLALTLAAWHNSQIESDRLLSLAFEGEVKQVRADLNTRIAGYTQTLRAAAALFSTADRVTRGDWHDYIAGLRLERGYPAIQAVAFARVVKGGELESLVSEVRKSGVADFALRPPGLRDRHVINVYSEPYTGLNIKALGYDMWQDADRRETMQRARDTGEPMITRRVTLKIDEQINPVPAFIMYMPVFRKPGLEEYGYVLSPFRMPALMDDLLRNASRSVSLSIHDGTEPRPENLFYSSDGGDNAVAATFVHREPMTVGGRTWTLTYASLPGFAARNDPGYSAPILIAGLLASALLFVLVWSLTTTRTRALALARDMTHSLAESRQQYLDLVEGTPDLVTKVGADGRFVFVNSTSVKIFGLPPEACIGRLAFDFVAPEDRETTLAAFSAWSSSGGETFELENRQVGGDGRISTVAWLIRADRDENGTVTGFSSTGRDTTQRKKQEEDARQMAMELDTILRNALVGIVHLRRRRIVSCNRRLEEIFGYDKGELVGQTTEALYASHEIFAGVGERAYADLVKNNSYSEEMLLRKKDGSLFSGALTGCAIDPARPHDGSIWIYADISERQKAESALKESRERFDLAVRGSSDGIWDWNIETGVTYVSDRWWEMLGYSPGEISFGPEGWTSWIHPEDRGLALSKMREHLKTRKPYASEYRMPLKNGEYRWFLNRGQAIWNAEGRAIRIAGSTSDISERKAAEEQLRKLSLAVDQSPESIVITNLDAEIEYVNEAFVRKTGYSREEVVGKNPRILNSGKTPAGTIAALWDALAQGQPWKGELHNRRKDGSEYIEHAIITPIRQPDGRITHYVAVKEDITGRKASEDQINTLAFYDPLTNLPNRRLLLDRLKQALASSARNNRYAALLFIDLDNFKTLNDTLGHDIGDLLLLQVAQRLTTCVREGDTVARLGGDEFVVMLEDLSENMEESAAQTKTVGEKILATLNQSYQLASYSHHSTPSIGVTLFSDQHETIDELLKRADLAMYQAKAAGRNTLRFFDPEMQAVVTARAALEADLRGAVLKDQFLLHYQAQVVGEGRITGAEVLLRWQHPQRGIVSPADFIPLAEDTGLIVPIGHWVLQTACDRLAIWATRPEMAHLTIAVNVSARQFHHKDFIEQVLAVLDQTGADPHRLKLELTESLLVDDVEGVITKMSALKVKGVGFSMDDFGTGYSSLSYLKRLPLDQLKIDQGFVRDILTDANDAAIAKMVIVLAESLGLSVIAEGVEIEAQRDFLARHGCHAYQGYLFSRPLPLAKFEEFARAMQA